MSFLGWRIIHVYSYRIKHYSSQLIPVNMSDAEMGGVRVGLSTTAVEQGVATDHLDGIGVYTLNLLRNMNKINGTEVRGFCYPESFVDIFRNRGEVSEVSRKLALPYLLSGFPSYVFGLADVNDGVISKSVDIYHCTDYKIPKLKSIPVVATLHDAVLIQHPDWGSPHFRAFKNKVLKNSINWVDHVVTISDFVVEDIVEHWGVPEEKVSVVHSGVDDYWFQKQSNEKVAAVRHKYRIEKPYVLFVGTFQPRKNIGRIIDAYLSLPEDYKQNHILVLAGRAGWGCDDLHVKVDKLVRKGLCIRLESASDDEVRCLYQGAEVFLFPSLYEGFGLPVLEAFASGVPVIASKNTALEEVAGDAALLVDPFSTDDIVDNLRYLLDLDQASRVAITEKGVERAKQFSWENTVLQLYDIYKSLV